MADPEMQRQLAAAGIEPAYSTPEAFAELIRADIAKWAKVVKASGARAD
jgi:tripartite-type tricarboxylate transporter receptor subunit TctC